MAEQKKSTKGAPRSAGSANKKSKNAAQFMRTWKNKIKALNRHIAAHPNGNADAKRRLAEVAAIGPTKRMR